jgi:hypothetical protein
MPLSGSVGKVFSLHVREQIPILASFFPSQCCGVCSAASLSPASSPSFTTASCTFPAIWRCSRNPRSSLPGSDHSFEKTGSFIANNPFGGPEYVLQYLARYTHRIAISNHRLCPA